ncbi:hypothetical protein DBV15_00856 [Temnothorax longispinosus]|uniref:Uncharacterized protein n=1 Tax=Temnothorax longispinosus TaxID=300112 RepID=A0A4S2KQD1_9HYME|nr:hypothetical protein DBV15_00856 [Temnothorax longispinosus]
MSDNINTAAIIGVLPPRSYLYLSLQGNRFGDNGQQCCREKKRNKASFPLPTYHPLSSAKLLEYRFSPFFLSPPELSRTTEGGGKEEERKRKRVKKQRIYNEKRGAGEVRGRRSIMMRQGGRITGEEKRGKRESQWTEGKGERIAIERASARDGKREAAGVCAAYMYVDLCARVPRLRVCFARARIRAGRAHREHVCRRDFANGRREEERTCTMHECVHTYTRRTGLDLFPAELRDAWRRERNAREEERKELCGEIRVSTDAARPRGLPRGNYEWFSRGAHFGIANLSSSRGTRPRVCASPFFLPFSVLPAIYAPRDRPSIATRAESGVESDGGGGGGGGEHAVDAVSYTHLDVYKRPPLVLLRAGPQRRQHFHRIAPEIIHERENRIKGRRTGALSGSHGLEGQKNDTWILGLKGSPARVDRFVGRKERPVFPRTGWSR